MPRKPKNNGQLSKEQMLEEMTSKGLAKKTRAQLKADSGKLKEGNEYVSAAKYFNVPLTHSNNITLELPITMSREKRLERFKMARIDLVGKEKI